MEYLSYNREERDLCAHLFHLLLIDQPNWTPLKEFLGKSDVKNPRIFSEVAIIRDAYNERKDDNASFIHDICQLIAGQNEITEYTIFSDLPSEIQNPIKTHPKQISHKLKNMEYDSKPGDRTVYGSLQAMFNAKPDLVVCEGDNLFVYEAKFTSKFSEEQMKRTKEIAEVWRELLFGDFGFDSKPKVQVFRLGMERDRVDVSWERIYDLAKKHLGENDFSTRSISKVLNI